MRLCTFCLCGQVTFSVLSDQAAAEPFPLKVTDDVGRTVEFAAPPKRIISCYGGFTEIVFFLGRGDRLVGVTRACKHPPAAAKIERIGTHLDPSTEKVVALRPDLLLATVGSTAKERFLGFERFGIKVLLFTPKTLEDVFSVMDRLSRVLMAEEKAIAAIAQLRRRVEVVRRAVKDRPRVRVFSEASVRPLVASGKSGVTDDVISLAGGENVITAPRKILKVGFEEIVAEDPDVYLIEVGPMNRYHADPSLRKRSQMLRAFRHNRAYEIDHYYIKRAGPRLVDGLEKLARRFHPHAFAHE